MEIAEVTPERWETVRAFVGDDAPEHWPAMTLVAEEDGKTLGVLLCDRDATGGYDGRVIVSSDDSDESIASALIDKATRKLQMLGVRCWRIETSEREDEPLWSAFVWPAQPVLDDARHVTRVRGVA